MIEAIKIICLCVGSAIGFGILLDNVTARVCVEYFTIGHEPIFNSTNPTYLAFGWGVVATWWAGLIVSLPMVLATRFGSRPMLAASALLRPFGVVLIVMAALCLLSGLLGFILASRGRIFLQGWLAAAVPEQQHVPFLADLFAHNAAYAGGFLGSLGVAVSAWRRRGDVQTPQKFRDELMRQVFIQEPKHDSANK